LNGSRVLKVNFPEVTTAELDTEKMNLISGDTYLNRYAVGEYEDLTLPQGLNDFTLTGCIEYFEVTRYSRWI
jgi:hypothetical protein